MTIVRGAFSNLIAPGYRKVIFETYKERPVEGNKLVNMGRANRAYIEDVNMAGFGTLLEKPEGGRVIYQDPLQGNPKRYTFSTYGLGFRITEEMMEDDLYGIVGNKFSRALGRSVRHNFEVVSHSVLNNAFNPLYYGYEVGVPLISTLHTNLRGGTQSNRPAIDADLSLTTLQAAVEGFHAWTDESGLQIADSPRLLVTGVSNMWTAGVLLGASQLPGGNFNDPNLLATLGLRHVVSHYITDPDAWFLISDTHDMNYFDRRMPTFSNTDDFDTGDAKFKVTRRNGAGFGDWRGVYGSPGA
jgi:hypothetical protein